MSDFFNDEHIKNPPPPSVIKNIEFKGEISYVSFSMMTVFEQCPYAVFLSSIKKLKGPKSKALVRGSELHELLEKYVKGSVTKINWKKFISEDYYRPLINSFRDDYKNGNIETELKLCFTQDMQETTWYAKDIWLRASIDVISFDQANKKATIYDYKTGSNQSAVKHRTQLMLYVLLCFLRYPDLEAIDATCIYLDHRVDNFYTNYLRNDLDLYWPRLRSRLDSVTTCREFTPNPNAYSCKFCDHKLPGNNLDAITVPACSYAYTA